MQSKGGANHAMRSTPQCPVSVAKRTRGYWRAMSPIGSPIRKNIPLVGAPAEHIGLIGISIIIGGANAEISF